MIHIRTNPRPRGPINWLNVAIWTAMFTTGLTFWATIAWLVFG